MAIYTFELGINWNQPSAQTTAGGVLEVGFVSNPLNGPASVAYPGNLQTLSSSSPDIINFFIYDTTIGSPPSFTSVKIVSLSTSIPNELTQQGIQPFTNTSTTFPSNPRSMTSYSFGGGGSFNAWSTNYGGNLLTTVKSGRYSMTISVQASASLNGSTVTGLWTVDPEMIVGGWAGGVP